VPWLKKSGVQKIEGLKYQDSTVLYTTKLSWTVFGEFNGGPLHYLLTESASLFHFPSRTAQAIIFVLDSSDDYRMVVAKDELDILLQHSGE